MSRRHARTSPLPDCAHTAAARASWEAARALAIADPEYYSYQYEKDHPRPDWGLCADCKAAWIAESPWRPELWAHVDSEAGTLPKGGKILRFDQPAKLPPAPKPRQETADKLKGRILDALETSRGKDLRDGPRASAMADAIIGPSAEGHWYRMISTNGHTALIEPATPAKGQEKRYPSIAQGGKEWIDLPASFHPALRRVRLLARVGEAIRLDYDGQGTLTLHARGDEGEASERILVDCAGSPGLLNTQPFACTLSADYLDLACGIWPLRWYLTQPEQRHNPPSRWHPKGETWTEDLPQHFQPGGATGPGWRFVIQPMRE